MKDNLKVLNNYYMYVLFQINLQTEPFLGTLYGTYVQQLYVCVHTFIRTYAYVYVYICTYVYFQYTMLICKCYTFSIQSTSYWS